MRYFLYLSYCGTNYSGWQTQPNAPSVQETLEQSLETILRTPTPIVGAGRTDAGVHARLMVAHADLDCSPTEASILADRLNRLLPQDIAIQRIVPMQADAHARFSATARTYRYYVALQRDPFMHSLKLRLYHSLDFEAMNQAAQRLMDYEDFTSFAKLHTDVKTNICHVTHALWTPLEGQAGQWVFTITANRFLRNMVRAIVGTLFSVGKGKLSPEGFARVIEGQDRGIAGSSAPAHALYLEDVTYPEELFLPIEAGQ